MTTLQGNDMDNLNLAFEIAERDLDIPKMLDAEGTSKDFCNLLIYLLWGFPPQTLTS